MSLNFSVVVLNVFATKLLVREKLHFLLYFSSASKTFSWLSQDTHCLDNSFLKSSFSMASASSLGKVFIPFTIAQASFHFLIQSFAYFSSSNISSVFFFTLSHNLPSSSLQLMLFSLA